MIRDRRARTCRRNLLPDAVRVSRLGRLQTLERCSLHPQLRLPTRSVALEVSRRIGGHKRRKVIAEWIDFRDHALRSAALDRPEAFFHFMPGLGRSQLNRDALLDPVHNALCQENTNKGFRSRMLWPIYCWIFVTEKNADRCHFVLGRDKTAFVLERTCPHLG